MITIQNKIFNPSIVKILVDNREGCELRIGVLSIDGTIKTFADEQIASFVELSVRRGEVDKGTAQEIRNSFKHIITDLRTCECPSISDLEKQYNVLYSQIQNHIFKAKENGKKVLILIGDDHRDRKSLLWELMILDIASKLGVKNLLTETNHAVLEKMKRESVDDVMSLNFLFVLKYAQKKGFETMPVDPGYSATIEKVRIIAMNQAIAKSNTDATFFVGANHLIEICTDKDINETYEILKINASNIGEEKKSHLFKSLSYPQHKLNFVLNSDNALQLNMPGNPYSLTFKEMKKLIKQINLQKDNLITKAMHIFAETKIKVPQIKMLDNKHDEDPDIETLNRKLKEYPHNIQNRLERADILYSRGRTSQALEDYRFVLEEYPTNISAQKGIENCTRKDARVEEDSVNEFLNQQLKGNEKNEQADILDSQEIISKNLEYYRLFVERDAKNFIANCG